MLTLVQVLGCCEEGLCCYHGIHIPMQVELALKVQLDYLETLTENSSFNGPQSTLEADINAYRSVQLITEDV